MAPRCRRWQRSSKDWAARRSACRPTSTIGWLPTSATCRSSPSPPSCTSSARRSATRGWRWRDGTPRYHASRVEPGRHLARHRGHQSRSGFEALDALIDVLTRLNRRRRSPTRTSTSCSPPPDVGRTSWTASELAAVLHADLSGNAAALGAETGRRARLRAANRARHRLSAGILAVSLH